MSKVLIDREVVEQATNALLLLKRAFFKAATLETADPEQEWVEPALRSIDALRAALEQPVVEPVAEVVYLERGGNAGIATRIVEIDDPYRERLQAGIKLYTAPQPAQQSVEEPLKPASEDDMRVYRSIAARYFKDTAPQPTQQPHPAEAQRDRLLAAIAEAQAGASWPTGAALLAGPIVVAVEQVKKEMREMTARAPGPWELEDRGYKYIVSKPGAGYITRDVCRMDGGTMSSIAQEANARLIAAAPELLEALKEIVSYWDSVVPTDCVNDMHIKARAAIAKVGARCER